MSLLLTVVAIVLFALVFNWLWYRFIWFRVAYTLFLVAILADRAMESDWWAVIYTSSGLGLLLVSEWIATALTAAVNRHFERSQP